MVQSASKRRPGLWLLCRAKQEYHHCERKVFQPAEVLFKKLNVEVVLASRFLGGFVGSEEGVQDFVFNKVSFWIEAGKRLADAAVSYPQSAYSAFTKSLSMEWMYLQRVVSGLEELCIPLRRTIQNHLTPSLFG